MPAAGCVEVKATRLLSSGAHGLVEGTDLEIELSHFDVGVGTGHQRRTKKRPGGCKGHWVAQGLCFIQEGPCD